MSEQPKLNEGRRPPLTGKGWDAYNKKDLERLTYNQDFMNALSSLRGQELSPEINKLINAALMSNKIADELLGHLNYERAKKAKASENGTQATINNKLAWENFVEQVVTKYAKKNPHGEGGTHKKRFSKLSNHVGIEINKADDAELVKNIKGNKIPAPTSPNNIGSKIKAACIKLEIWSIYSK
jgi:hypothetical protein